MTALFVFLSVCQSRQNDLFSFYLTPLHNGAPHSDISKRFADHSYSFHLLYVRQPTYLTKSMMTYFWKSITVLRNATLHIFIC